tara:strand:- start:36 stop:329 length:294 start_codon:yes stop_codon:yes gene_type:complete
MAPTAIHKAQTDDDDIYIDCKPVDTIGNVIGEEQSNVSQEVLSDFTTSIGATNLQDNVGIQAIIGITIMGVLYIVGDYVFKQFPKGQIEKQMNLVQY